MTATGSTIHFGHFYWELRADAVVEAGYWLQLRRMMQRRFADHEELLADRLTETLLPFDVNRRLFSQVNLLFCRDGWQRTVHLWQRRSRRGLCRQLLGDYRDECLERMVRLLCEQDGCSLLHEDPSGSSTIGFAKLHRRHVRRIVRAGLPAEPVVSHALASHAPAILSDRSNAA